MFDPSWPMVLPAGDDSTIVMNEAEHRALIGTRLENTDGDGFLRIKPTTIFCAEPSADVVKVASQATNIGANLEANLPSGISPELAFAISQSRAEAAAQLTERLATIQLLRDALYRACEAYSNGALSETAYAILLSRYDDTMVTMLMGEFMAGNFGRSLATLVATTSGNADSVVRRAVNAELLAKDELDAAESAVAEARTAAAAAPDNEESEKRLTQAEAARERSFQSYLEARATSVASATATPVGAANITGGADLSDRLARMQRKFVENINSDAVVVACLIALERKPSSDFAKKCLGRDDRPGIIDHVLHNQAAVLRLLVWEDHVRDVISKVGEETNEDRVNSDTLGKVLKYLEQYENVGP